MEFNGIQWISVDFNGIQRNGIQWNSVEFNGFQWIAMEFNHLLCAGPTRPSKVDLESLSSACRTYKTYKKKP